MLCIADRYTNSKPNLLEFLSVLIFQRMLLQFSKQDSSSSELLCFGYQINAKRNSLN